MEEKLAATLGAAARAARQRAGFTQADVAEKVNIATEVYGRLERGRMLPSAETLRTLCLALDVSADEMLGIDERTRAREPKARSTDSPEIRRLTRRIRELDARSLRLLGLIATRLAGSH